ncbi:sensor histidine kinase, partial [Nocardia sp. NPDC004722]
ALRSPVPAHVRVDRLGRYRPEIETALYYCCLEAMQNSAKHGGPGTTVTIAAQQHGGTLLFTLSDTGCGFDPTAAGPGLGLTNMNDRLAVIGGTLTIDSAPGMGTRLTAAVPTRPLRANRGPVSESR